MTQPVLNQFSTGWRDTQIFELMPLYASIEDMVATPISVHEFWPIQGWEERGNALLGFSSWLLVSGGLVEVSLGQFYVETECKIAIVYFG